MKVYCVRQKSTGLFIPRLKTGQRRGGSHLEPSNEREPRVFHNEPAAKAFLGMWMQGTFENDTYIDSMSGEQEDTLRVTHQPHRKKDDMEIVAFDCIEIIGIFERFFNTLDEAADAVREHFNLGRKTIEIVTGLNQVSQFQCNRKIVAEARKYAHGFRVSV